MSDRATVALAAHEEYRGKGYEPIPIRLDKFTDDRGVEKKRPKFPGGTWKTAREIGRDPDRLRSFVERGFVDVALVCEGIAGLDFDLRDGETWEELEARAKSALTEHGIRRSVIERTGRGYHGITKAPAENGRPWAKLVWGAPHPVDEVQVGEGALIFVAPSFHPVADRPYERLTDLRAVDELPECPVELLTPPARPESPARDARAPRQTGTRSRGDWSTLDIVGLFRAAGLYGKDLGGGKHGVRCPWEADHTTGSDGTDSVVFEAAGTTGPGFRCLHAHCEGKGIREVRDHFGTEEIDRWCVEEWRPATRVSTSGNGAAGAAESDTSQPEPPGNGTGELSRPQIMIRQELTAVTDEAVNAIMQRPDLGVFVRGRILVTVGRDGSARKRWLKRAPGSPIIVPIERARMLAVLDQAAEWVKWNVKEKAAHPARPAEWVGEQVRARLEWPFRYLEAVVETPTIRPDGTIIDMPGWDEDTCLLFDPLPGVEWPTVPDRPSLDEVHMATEVLLDPVAEFPFVTDSDRAAYVATVLSMLARHRIEGPVPMFVIRTPTPGTGKTLLASAAGLIGTGREPAIMTMTFEGEEFRKRVTALAVGGMPLVLIDNLSGSIGSDTLAAALTASEWEDRVLGISQMVRVPLRTVWLATGNNIGFRRTLGRRVIPIDLDAGIEVPEDRTGFRYPNLMAHVRQSRAELVTAALTILRGFHLAGCPKHGEPRMGSFEAWDDVIRSAVIWAGLADPATTEDGVGRGRVRAQSDDDLEGLGTLLEALAGEFPAAQPFATAQVIKKAKDNDEFGVILDSVAAPGKGGRATARSVGARFRDHQDRPVGGLVLRKVYRTWRVERVGA